ncbi:hypothetical protein AB0I28_06410 [Phytomonospora sp. NPDC050363]|uniref:hypothetical protein n=1 Tax=Phytomonospora sp. NPDC050363 TaxID=3155642 RepID=UPI0033CAAAF6
MTPVHREIAARLRRVARLAREAARQHADRSEQRAMLAHDRLVGAAEDADRAARVVGSGARRWHGVAARYAGAALAATAVAYLPYGEAPMWVLCVAVVFAGLAGGKLATAAHRRLRRKLGSKVPHVPEPVVADALTELRQSLVDVRGDLPAQTARIPLRPVDRGESVTVGELLANAETCVCQAYQALSDEDWYTGSHRFPDGAFRHESDGCALAVTSGRVSRALRPVMWSLLRLDSTREYVANAVGRLATARDLMLQSAMRLDHPPTRGLGPAARDTFAVCCGLVATLLAWFTVGSPIAVVVAFLVATVVSDVVAARSARLGRLEPAVAEMHCAELAGILTELADGPAAGAATTAARRNAQVAADFMIEAVADLAARAVGLKPNQS